MKIQKILKVLLLIVLVAVIRADDIDEEDFDEVELTSTEPANEEPTQNLTNSGEGNGTQNGDSNNANVDTINEPLAPELEELETTIFSNGKKVGKGLLQLKSMKDSIASLAQAGTDLDKYSISHRGVVFKNFVSLDEESANFMLRINDEFTICPYRYLRTDFECVSDTFLGFSCGTVCKKGKNDDDFLSEIHFTFGYCCTGLEESQLMAVESTVELLINAHKEILSEKIRKAEDAITNFQQYNELHTQSVNNQNEASKIPELEAKYSEKQAECDIREKDFETAKADYENEQAIVNKNKDEINVLNSEVRSLSARKQALEQEQIQVRSQTLSHESRVNRMKEFEEDIEAAFQVVRQTIDPNFFDGRNCFVNGNVDQFCLDRLNRC